MISFFYHLAVGAICLLGIRIGAALDNQNMIKVSGFLLAFHLLTFRVIPILRWIQEMLIPEAVCFTCGEVIDLISQYRCGCGFISYKERHAFSPCPMCGKYFRWVVCPACETSIPI